MTPERVQVVDAVLQRRQPDLTVLAENLHKPRNFSALVRSCDAVGIHCVHAVSEGEARRKHWHTSSGAEKWIHVALHESTAQACTALKAQGFRIYAAHLSDQAVDYREVDYTKPSALLMGTELFGVSDAALMHVDQQIMIPMMGMGQSLNVSVAASVVLYEAMAQRRAAGLYDVCRLPEEVIKRDRFVWLHAKLADYCDRHGLDYPELDENGDLLEPFPQHLR